MHPYGVREVERLLQLPRSTIRALIQAGFVTPTRGPRRAWRFSFQDLIVLRTAQALARAKVPAKRITRSMRELRRHLPQSMPLSGLSIAAVADRVVVREGTQRWQAESGQYLLAFGGDPASGSLTVMEQRAEPEPDADAYINRGVEMHEAGRLADAEKAYREGLVACGADPVLHFNLGVVLEDLGRREEAIDAYRAALREDPRLADGHYNLALAYEAIGRGKDALRHMAQYRRLTARG
jgi:tetratricopeptide (TPR) repeat protein